MSEYVPVRHRKTGQVHYYCLLGHWGIALCGRTSGPAPDLSTWHQSADWHGWDFLPDWTRENLCRWCGLIEKNLVHECQFCRPPLGRG